MESIHDADRGVMSVSNIKLFPHQEQALEAVKDQNKVAFYLDMG